MTLPLFNSCPKDPSETAELYLLNKLSVDENRRVEEHLLSCSGCMDVLEQTESFMNALRAANRDKVCADNPGLTKVV